MHRLFTLIPIIMILLASSSVAFAQESCLYGKPGCSGLPAPLIEEYPTPNIQPLQVDESVLYDRTYRKVEGDFQIFDSPNGNIIDSYPPGFTYVTLSSSVEGWAEIEPGKWVRTDGLTDNVVLSRYSGVLLPEEPLPYTMAWTLKHIRASSHPGEDENPDNPFMYRYTRVNIYSAVELDGYVWYQIGQDQWVHQFDVAKILIPEKPEGVNTDKWVAVDLYEQVLVAFEDTTPVFATLVSSGLSQWSTNEGLFNIYFNKPRTIMSGAYNQPDFYFLEEVPYTMYFDDDIALHGTYWHDGFGYRQSHGCVNMSITDAKWLYDWAASEFDWEAEGGASGASVYVYSSGDYE